MVSQLGGSQSPIMSKDPTGPGPLNINLQSGNFVPDHADPKILNQSLQSLEYNVLDSGDENQLPKSNTDESLRVKVVPTNISQHFEPRNEIRSTDRLADPN